MSLLYECPLCKAEALTNRYYENRVFWIADCATCKVPMAVLREHRSKPQQWELDEMLKVCRSMFNMDKCEVDYTMRQISGHFHFHLRPIEEREEVTDEEEQEEPREQELQEEETEPEAKD